MLAHTQVSRNSAGLGARRGALESDGGRPAREHAGDLDAVLDRAALVGDRPARRPRRAVEPLQCFVIELMADQRMRRLVDNKLGPRDRAAPDTRVAPGAARVE